MRAVNIAEQRKEVLIAQAQLPLARAHRSSGAFKQRHTHYIARPSPETKFELHMLHCLILCMLKNIEEHISRVTIAFNSIRKIHQQCPAPIVKT